jgi:hypothetical protein
VFADKYSLVFAAVVHVMVNALTFTSNVGVVESCLFAIVSDYALGVVLAASLF